MQFVAISMFSASSAVRVPSLSEVLRKSITDSARRFLESGSDYSTLADQKNTIRELVTYHGFVSICRCPRNGIWSMHGSV